MIFESKKLMYSPAVLSEFVGIFDHRGSRLK